MFCSLYVCALIVFVFRSAHCNVITLDDDFNKVLSEKNITNDDIISKIVAKIKSFNIKVHPRIYLYYKLLHKAVWKYARQHGVSFYDPNKYRTNNAKTHLRHTENKVDQRAKGNGNKTKLVSSKIVYVHANNTQEHSPVLRVEGVLRQRTRQTTQQQSVATEPEARLPDYADYL